MIQCHKVRLTNETVAAEDDYEEVGDSNNRNSLDGRRFSLRRTDPIAHLLVVEGVQVSEKIPNKQTTARS